MGAGIAGLAAAAALRRERPDVDVVVLESSDRVGGKLALAEVGGVTVDVGAESILARRPEGVELARASGLGDRVVHPATISAQIWSRDSLRRMPRSVLGVPLDGKELADSGLLSKRGLARAAMDGVLPPTEIGDSDVSVGWLIEERFGRELLDRLVEPLLGGVYAGHAREISARAAAPQVVALLEKDRSLMKAAAATMDARSSSGPVFAGLVGGVGQLPVALAAGGAGPALDVRLGTTVRDLERTAEGGWRLVTGPVVSPETIGADAVVVATPGAAAARLLAGCAPDAAAELGRIEYASMAVVTLAFAADTFPEVTGSGFLVPPVEGRRVKAATYSFQKWDWVRAASPDVRLMRVSVGRHREEHELQVPDEELVERSVLDLADAVGLAVRPVDWHVQRWGGGLPQYAVGHPDRVRRIRSSVAAAPGLAVCGAAYDGLGIPACIASAEAAARQVLDQLPSPSGEPAHGRGTMAP
ncbi:MAG: protoporphyrinogen/coproporphyrinogen oxidase [Nocardioidaceae bacterium]|nr:protoporphyrinogen/coproporphyrinogen oxidase [Nocardioidaceae bacterium]